MRVMSAELMMMAKEQMLHKPDDPLKDSVKY